MRPVSWTVAQQQSNMLIAVHWPLIDGRIGLLVRPKAIACGADLSFTPDVFLFFLHSRNLRYAWADRREILHGGQY